MTLSLSLTITIIITSVGMSDDNMIYTFLLMGIYSHSFFFVN